MQDIFAMSRPRPGTVRQLTLAAFALVIGVIGLSPGARAADTLKVGKAIAVGFTFVPLDVGMHAGIFKKYGLDIQSIAFRGDAKLQQAMAAGGRVTGRRPTLYAEGARRTGAFRHPTAHSSARLS